MVLNVSTNLPGGMTNADYNRLASSKVEFIKVTELPTSYIQEYPYLYILEKDNSKGEIYEYRSSTGWHQYGGDGAIVPITQADYDKLSTEDKNNGIFYLITDKLLYKGDITVMEGSTTSTNGKSGLTPAPVSGDPNRSLRADGSWKLPDSALSSTSTNSLQTKVANAEFNKKAPLASPALTGTPTAPTASAGTNNTQIATTAFVTKAVSDGVAPKAPIASPTLTGTPKAPTAAAGTNTTQIATTAFVTTAVSNGIAASDAMIIKGTIGTNGTVTALPTTYKTGWTYRVVTSGTYAGQVCEIGDLIVALVDRSGSGNVDADWCVAQTNINGAITGIKTGDAYIGVSQSGSVVTITHKDVTRTNTTSTAKPSHGGTFTAVKSVTSDAKGHVTGVDTETVTLPTYTALKNPNAISINGKSYDGSSKVDVGTIGVAYGGTGAKTATAAEYNVLGSMTEATSAIDDSMRWAFVYKSPSPTTGWLYFRTASMIWDYIKGKISSVLGLTDTAFGGNAASATKLATARTIALTGSVTGSGTFDGSGNLSIATTTNHTHSYAGSSSAGGSATSAVKLDTATAGSATQPVYFKDGKPAACTYTLGKSVPSNAVFTDTHFTSHLYVGASGGNANATSATSNPYLLCVDNTTNRNSIQLKAGTNMSISAVNGVVTFSSSYTNTTYSPGTGLALSGTTFNHKNSVTAGTAQGDANKTLTFGGTFTIPTVTYDAQGHITGKGTTTMTMPKNPNTDTKNTTGSTDTSSKIFLVGATSQAANPQTYSDNQVYVTNGLLDANKMRVATKVTMQYNSSTESLDFVFA